MNISHMPHVLRRGALDSSRRCSSTAISGDRAGYLLRFATTVAILLAYAMAY